MAFENLSDTTTTTHIAPQPFKYWTVIIVCGSFLVVCLILSYFQKPIQTSWHNWRTRQQTQEIVQLPPVLIATPVSTPNATVKPNLTPVPVAIASPTPTPYSAPTASPVAKGSNLPKTGPDTGLEVATITLASASSLYGYRRYQKANLRIKASTIHIL